jgi:hypothetical protein
VTDSKDLGIAMPTSFKYKESVAVYDCVVEGPRHALKKGTPLYQQEPMGRVAG